MIRGETWYMIRDLLRQGLSISAIARQTGLSRPTIRKIRDEVSHPRPSTRQPRASKLDPFKPYLQERFAAGVVNATKLYQEVQAQGYAGKASILRAYLQPFRVRSCPVTERFETLPGAQAQVDWGEYGHLLHEGRRHRLSFFLLTLSYCRRSYLEFVTSQDEATLLRCHLHAFAYFGGVPATILYDNPKTIVRERRADGTPVWNARFRDFADTEGFTPRLCAVRRPQTKGKVESDVGYVKGNFLLGLDLDQHTLTTLNGEALRWLREVADVRVHGTLHERPRDRWPVEAAVLHPFLRPDVDTSRLSYRQVQRDAFIAYGTNRYSVPPEVVGQVVLVKEGEDGVLQILAQDRVVATHALVAARHRLVRAPGHEEVVRAYCRARRRPAQPTVPPAALMLPVWPAVEQRPLTAYDVAVGLGG